MTRLAAVAALGLVAACAGPAPSGPQPKAAAAPTAPAPPAPAAAARAGAIELRNAGFEAEQPAGNTRCAPAWDCTVHGGPESYRFYLEEGAAATGKRSLCVERVGGEPWGLVTQAFQTSAFRGQRLRLTLSVRLEGVTGDGAGPWMLSQGGHAHAARLERGTSGWQRMTLELAVPRDSTMVVVGATLEGPGKACFDDVRLETVPG